MESQIIAWIINGLMGVIMWLGKVQLDTLQKRIDHLEDGDDYIKEYYFKKEDFKEFKQELYMKLDKMETSLENKLDTIKSFRLSDFSARNRE